MTRPKKKTCGLCGSDRMGKKPGVLQYKVSADEIHQELMEMPICEMCADSMDTAIVPEEPEEVRDWLLRKGI